MTIAEKRPEDIPKLIGICNRCLVARQLFLLPDGELAQVDLKVLWKLKCDMPWEKHSIALAFTDLFPPNLRDPKARWILRTLTYPFEATVAALTVVRSPTR